MGTLVVKMDHDDSPRIDNAIQEPLVQHDPSVSPRPDEDLDQMADDHASSAVEQDVDEKMWSDSEQPLPIPPPQPRLTSSNPAPSAT